MFRGSTVLLLVKRIYLKRRDCDIAYRARGTTAIILLVLCCHGHVNPHPSPTVVTKRADKVVSAGRQSCDRNLSRGGGSGLPSLYNLHIMTILVVAACSA